MAKSDLRKLGRSNSGKPGELSISLVQGNQGNFVALPGSSTEDSLVSVLHAAAGSSLADITSTATLAHGSVSPGVDVDTDQLIVYWYKF